MLRLLESLGKNLFFDEEPERWIKRAFKPPKTVRKPYAPNVTIYNLRLGSSLACGASSGSVPKNTKGPNYSIRKCNGILANETVLDRF